MTLPLTFAIGDIHGCDEALLALLQRCAARAAGAPHRLVFLGDYVDRGPDSRRVIQILRDLEARRPDDIVCLMGNHEELLLDAAAGGDPMRWFMNGGRETVESYAAKKPAELPADDVAWIRSLRLCFDDGKRFFAHAGVDPDIALDQQTSEALLWIRGRFHESRKDHGRLIVHGHTPCRDGHPEVRPNRINIDTASVYGGALTAAVFTAEETAPVDFLSVPGLR